MATTPTSALDFIREEHAAIRALFDRFDGESDDVARRAIVDEAILRLDLHAQLKEELVYPALEEALGEDALAEAAGRHEDIEEALDAFVEADDEALDADAFKALSEQMTAHFDEEEEALEALADKTEIDHAALGRQLTERREELRREIGERGDLED